MRPSPTRWRKNRRAPDLSARTCEHQKISRMQALNSTSSFGWVRSHFGRIQLDPVTEIFGMPADPGSHVSVRCAPDNVVFYQNTQLPERSAHDPESLFLILQERMEYQYQVPTIPDYALHRLAQSPPETERGKRLFRTSEGLPQTTEARQIVVSVEMPPGER